MSERFARSGDTLAEYWLKESDKLMAKRNDRTIMQMEVHPKLIEARRQYRERLKRYYEGCQNIYGTAQWAAQQHLANQLELSSILGGLLGSIGSGAARHNPYNP